MGHGFAAQRRWLALLLLGAAVVCVPWLAAAAGGAEPAVASCKGPLEPSVVGGCDLALAGCCDSTGRLLYCQGKDLYCIDCPGSFPACGWAPLGPGSTLGNYDCGTAGGSDPSGVHPKSCATCPASCVAGAACSPACAGSCGKCLGAGQICLNDGSCYTPQCAGLECGSDPKGFSCGVCGPGLACEPGLQKCLPIPKACQGSKSPGCSGCGCESCVCAKHPFCCSVAWDAFCAGACENECGYSCKPCPAKPSCAGLGCGEFCGLDCGSCGKGKVCHKYQCCTPDCDGKTCGPDGCGGQCGSCPGNGDCVLGNCVACQPKCDGKSCGPDGCGGECGDCPDPKVCAQGKCLDSLCAGQCGGGPFKDGAGKDCYCDDQCTELGDCCAGACVACPDNKGCCKPSCEGKKCGDNGCGGACGVCPEGGLCTNGQCPACKVDCAGKTCGPDGCGGSCGSCPTGKDCNSGTCTCPLTKDTICCDKSLCLLDSCGQVGPPLYPCTYGCSDGQCSAPCQPSCVGKVCGSNGCGGSCGSCQTGFGCQEGFCQAQSDGGSSAAADAKGGDASSPAAAKPAPVSASDGGCSSRPWAAISWPGWLLLMGPVLGLVARRRRRRALLVAAVALLGLGCGKQTPPPAAAVATQADANTTDAPKVALDSDAAPDADPAADTDAAPDADPDAVLDGATDAVTDAQGVADADSTIDAPLDSLADLGIDASADATTVDVAEPATLVYDCANLPQGPFPLEKIPGAVASEDIAFDNQGNLVGSNNTALFKTKAGAKAKLWIPGVNQRAGMRYLPDGKLAVCDDKLGRILVFDEDGSQKVLVQGLAYPNGITTDLKGFIYVTEHDGSRVLRIHPYTGAYTVLTNQIKNPNGIIFNPDFTQLYIGSFGSGYIYKLALSASGVPGKLVKWASPIGPGGLLDGIAVDACGNVYVCEYGATDIWRIPASGGAAVKIIDGDTNETYLPNLQWGGGKGWDPMSIYIPDGWKIGVWRVELGVPSAPRPFP